MQDLRLAIVPELERDTFEIVEDGLGGLTAQDERLKHLGGQVATLDLHTHKISDVVQFALGNPQAPYPYIEPPLRIRVLPTAKAGQTQIVEQRGDTNVDDLPLADTLRLPKTGRERGCDKMVEVALGIVAGLQFDKVAQVLAGSAPIVASLTQPLRQLHRADVDVLQGEVFALTDARLVDVGDVVERVRLALEQEVLLVGNSGGLGIEPHGMIAHAGDVHGVPLARTDENGGQAFVGVGSRNGIGIVRIVGGRAAQFVEGKVDFTQAVDEVFGVDAAVPILGHIDKTVLLVELVGLVDLVEVATVAGKDRIIVVGVYLRRLVLFDNVVLTQRHPPEALHDLLADKRTHDEEFVVGEVLLQIMEDTGRLVGAADTLLDRGAIDLFLQRGVDTQLVGEQLAGVGEREVVELRIEVDGVQPFGRATAPIIDRPIGGAAFALDEFERGRGGLLVPNAELAVGAKAVGTLGVEAHDDVLAVISGLQDFLFQGHRAPPCVCSSVTVCGSSVRAIGSNPSRCWRRLMGAKVTLQP